MEIEALVEQLQEWAQQHNLIEAALEGCHIALQNMEQDDEEIGLIVRWKLNDIQPRFDKQSLVFKHDILDYPYVETQIGLYLVADSKGWFRDLEPIGTYRLVTALDGHVVDDVLVWDNACELGKAKSYQVEQVREALDQYTGEDKDGWLRGQGLL